MIDNPLVTIIMPVYKNVKWLPEAINSVIGQKYDNYELVVVNDGSPEDVDYFIKPFLNFNKIKYYKYDTNKGISYARNFGISKSSGQYILPVDADDVICDSRWLTHCVEKINEETIVTSFVGLYDKTMKSKNEIWPHDKINKTWSKIINRNNVIGPSMYPKSMWEKIGGYDEKMLSWEDWEFWIRAYKAGYKLIRLNHVYYHYRQHDEGNLSKHNALNYDIEKYLRNKHPII
jgi:glycosyltransferase involved in cell wall biosynthesis